MRKYGSLLDMVKFKGETFFGLAQFLGVLNGLHMGQVAAAQETLRAVAKLTNKQVDLSQLNFQLPEGASKILRVALAAYRPVVVSAGLTLSLKSMDRLTLRLATPMKMEDAVNHAKDLVQRIQDELEDVELWQVAREHLKYIGTDAFDLGGPEKFKSARRDIEEAGKCLAFDRGTACVFHLMRVMECGLRALGNSLNDPDLDPRRNPTWERILRKCDDELRLPLKDRSPEWRQDDVFFSQATANLRAVKDAWRNPSLHVERDYMPDEAEDVWNAVRAFMRHLAKKLNDCASSSELPALLRSTDA